MTQQVQQKTEPKKSGWQEFLDVLVSPLALLIAFTLILTVNND